ncbi:mitochondrial 2-oxodicarboxylate carrier [Drosophila nasuta]|uniref:mitochondrial 2-oxodicarboxylate carrier n=1 Tax=Drosophila nasuta TaxID=42062 RepID=UPI00295E71F7|nr:mitochondrial 2-oxodicarboxylate carrier [Drosophila nasuta]
MPFSETIPGSAIPRSKRIQIQLLSGGTTGIVEVSLLTPLDFVKTRLQLQINSATKADSNYNGLIDAFAKIYRQEGITAFWRGMIPPLLSDTPRRAIKFMAFEQLKPVFLFGAASPTFITYVLAAGIAGMIEGSLQNPFEVVKITQQANRKKKLNTATVAKKIFKKGGFGLQGFFKGVTATACRNGIYHVSHLGFFSTVRDATPACKTKTREFVRKVGLAIIFSWMGCLMSIPFDVTKSRIQGPQPFKGHIKYSRAFRTLCTIYKEEGFAALYKGLTPQIIRQAPAGVILLLGYDFMSNFLSSKLV